MESRNHLRIVVKIGTSSLLRCEEDGTTNLALSNMATVAETLSELRNAGHDVVLVSSGAVGAGCHRASLKERPENLMARRALASMGQVHLMGKYDLLFSSLGKRCAQVLLTYENFVDREQFLNAKSTFDELFKFGVVPIVNENDTVGIYELKADNDRLACRVGNMIDADVVFLMTDVNGVFTANPNTDPSAKRITFVEDFDELRRVCKLGNGEDARWGTGGMAAKISAAELATSLGVRAVIMHADDCTRITEYVETQAAAISQDRAADETGSEADSNTSTPHFPFGTTFERHPEPPRERERWIRSLMRRGVVVVDEDAVKQVQENSTIFAEGVVSVEGEFSAAEAVTITDEKGNELGCGLINFSSEDLRKIQGMCEEEVLDLVDQSGAVIESKNLGFAAEVDSASSTGSRTSSVVLEEADANAADAAVSDGLEMAIKAETAAAAVAIAASALERAETERRESIPGPEEEVVPPPAPAAATGVVVATQ